MENSTEETSEDSPSANFSPEATAPPETSAFPEGSPPVENSSPPKGGGGKKPTKVLPSPRLAVLKQLEVLRAFAVATQAEDGAAITNDKAGSIMSVKMSGNTVVVSNAFLCEVQLLTRKGGAFEVSEIAKSYQQAYEWNPSTAGLKLAPAFADRWFAKTLLPRLKMRDWPRKEAIQVLAETAGATKEYEENVAMLLEFMAESGLLRLEGDLVKASNASVAVSEVQGPIDTQKGLIIETPKGDICYLNKERTRSVTVIAPLDINAVELRRLKSWLDLNYFAEEDDKATP